MFPYTPGNIDVIRHNNLIFIHFRRNRSSGHCKLIYIIDASGKIQFSPFYCYVSPLSVFVSTDYLFLRIYALTASHSKFQTSRTFLLGHLSGYTDHRIVIHSRRSKGRIFFYIKIRFSFNVQNRKQLTVQNGSTSIYIITIPVIIFYCGTIENDVCFDSLCHHDMGIDQRTIDLIASRNLIISIFCNIDLDDFYHRLPAKIIHDCFVRYKRCIRQIVGSSIFRRYRKCFHFLQCRLSFRIRIGIRYKWNAGKHRRRQCCNADDFFCLSANLSVVKIILSSHNFPPSLISIHFRLLMFCS